MATLTIKGKSYEISMSSLTNREAMEVERVTGKKFFAWVSDMTSGPNMHDVTAFVYVLQRRDNADLSFDDVEFTIGDWSNALDDDGDKTPAGNDSAPDLSST